MNKDKVAGAVQEAGGKARFKVGQITGDEKGQAAGIRDAVTGNVRKNIGKVKDALND